MEASPLKYYFEPRQGRAFARRLVVKVAEGKLIGFLDDDNWPTADWVYAAYCFAQSHPQAGAYGSKIQGQYEVEPPENFGEIACFLAVSDRFAYKLDRASRILEIININKLFSLNLLRKK